MLGIDGARIHQRFLEMAYVEGDQAAVARETQWYAGKPEEYLSFGLQAANRNVLGQRRESSKLYKRAAETALRRGLRDVAAGFEEADARADALSGNCQTVRRLGRPALALAMCGDAAEAEKLAAETSKLFPNGTVWNAVQLPEIRAAIELQRDQPAKAVELLASASPYERAYPEAVYLRGLAYLRLRKGAEAAAEFQKIVDHKGASWGSTWQYPNWGLYYSISYLGLARASRSRATQQEPGKAFKTSSHCGRTRTRICPFWLRPEKNSLPFISPRQWLIDRACFSPSGCSLARAGVLTCALGSLSVPEVCNVSRTACVLKCKRPDAHGKTETAVGAA